MSGLAWGLLDRLRVPLSWLGVISADVSAHSLQDNCLGLAAELAYCFFLALFPALLFFVALASFFPIDRLTDHVLSALDRFAPPDVLSLIRDQFLQISKHNNGGLGAVGEVRNIKNLSWIDLQPVLTQHLARHKDLRTTQAYFHVRNSRCCERQCV